jgi:hypothetical protein
MEKKEKNIELNDISIEEALQTLVKEKHKIIEAFAKAYLAETELLPSQVELVTQQTKTGNLIEHVYYFRRKE